MQISVSSKSLNSYCVTSIFEIERATSRCTSLLFGVQDYRFRQASILVISFVMDDEYFEMVDLNIRDIGLNHGLFYIYMIPDDAGYDNTTITHHTDTAAFATFSKPRSLPSHIICAENADHCTSGNRTAMSPD